MPDLPRTQCRTIEVDADFLPSPATKLVVTQYLEVNQDPPLWAWIVVGAFLDQADRVLWSSELFVALLDVEFESDDDEDQSQSQPGDEQDVSDSSSAAHSSDLNSRADEPASLSQDPSRQPLQHHFALQPSSIHSASPPTFWDPTQHGPVPGHWQASFDPSARRWVHTWHSHF
ncbi:hypothetical protein CDD83_8516 [Cordyceps sp. RAO-2017]|nr:hypothetical protein CDD83_8516 [Cordyceps sp. RAO-2017]